MTTPTCAPEAVARYNPSDVRTVVALGVLLGWFAGATAAGVAPQGDNPFKPRPQPSSPPSASAKRPKPKGSPGRARPAPPVAALQPPARSFLVDWINLEMLPIPVNGRTLYLSRYEVTQAQWEKVMGFNPSRRRGPDLPVTNVSLRDINEFLNRLNRVESNRPVTYRLPTSDEWYAAAKIGFNRDAQSWHRGNSLGKLQPVGGKSPNGFDLHDMTGNVWEWCADGYVCGGAYDSPPNDVAPDVVYPPHSPLSSDFRKDNVGFRLAASPFPRK